MRLRSDRLMTAALFLALAPVAACAVPDPVADRTLAPPEAASGVGPEAPVSLIARHPAVSQAGIVPGQGRLPMLVTMSGLLLLLGGALWSRLRERASSRAAADAPSAREPILSLTASGGRGET